MLTPGNYCISAKFKINLHNKKQYIVEWIPYREMQLLKRRRVKRLKVIILGKGFNEPAIGALEELRNEKLLG